jgi:imidazolonepropionase-like amidohydrolase
VTAVPAKMLGLSARIGALRGGYDADVVVWDRHPLRVGARPAMAPPYSFWLTLRCLWTEGFT